MHSCRVMALLIGALSLCSCDLIVDKIREGGGGNAPGGGGSSSGPTPPSLPTSDAAAPPVLPPPPPPSRCQDWTGAGDETTCKSQEDWKRYAYDACQAQNLILNDYGVGGGDCGAGMTRMVKYQCCAASVPTDPGNSGTPGTPPGTTTPPGPITPPPPNRCADIVVAGDETTCRSQDEWKLYAYEACQAQKLNLNDYSVGGGDCAPGKTRQVKYQCCAPLPPDPGNSGSGGGSGTPGSMPGTSTPGTGSTGSGGACTGGSEGGATSCKSVATWREYATENCARQNLVLTDLGFGESCGTDFYRYMKFVCCPGK